MIRPRGVFDNDLGGLRAAVQIPQASSETLEVWWSDKDLGGLRAAVQIPHASSETPEVWWNGTK